MRVGSQVVKDTRLATEGRIRSPSSLRMSLFLEQLRCPTGGMFDLDDLDFSERAISNQASGVTHHRVTRVVVRQA